MLPAEIVSTATYGNRRAPIAVTPNIDSDKRKLIFAVSLLLTFGLAAIALMNYFSARAAISESIAASALPLTSDNIYTEIQKDLLRPVLISSLMANDTFLHDWVSSGEHEVERMTRYLQEVKSRYGAFTSFFVSDRTRTYYQAEGVLKTVDPDDARDAWYFRVSNMSAPYELNVDPDAANKDALTIFINYRVIDGDKYIGAAGVGLTVDAVRRLIESYQERYQRNIYFVDRRGVISLFARSGPAEGKSIQDIEGLKDIAADIFRAGGGTFRYKQSGRDHLLNVRFIPELDWYLFVTQDEDAALAGARRTLYIHLAGSVLITALVLLLTTFTIGRYQRRLREMATTDKLTGLANRQAFDLLVPQAIRDAARGSTPLIAILLDIDRFKAVNDGHGHSAGDAVIVEVGNVIRSTVRSSDLVFRWGGEEYLVVAKSRVATEGETLAEKIRDAVARARISAGGHDFSMTISAGVAAYQPDTSIDEWIARADRALYAAKALGRDAVQVG